MSATVKLQDAIKEQEGRIALAESNIQRKLEAGLCSPQEADHSLRLTVGRMKARLAFLKRQAP